MCPVMVAGGNTCFNNQEVAYQQEFEIDLRLNGG